MRVFLMALAVTLIGPILALASTPLKADGPRLVIVPPWVNADVLVVQAGGQVIGPIQAPLGALAYSEKPNFDADLRKHGAIAVLDGAAIARICGV